MANCANAIRMMYQDEKVIEGTAHTIYTNHASAGAMRAYGIPQAAFIQESFMDDMARELGIDPIDIRKQNMMKLGYRSEEHTSELQSHDDLVCRLLLEKKK